MRRRPVPARSTGARRRRAAVVAAAVASVGLVGCGGGTTAADAPAATSGSAGASEEPEDDREPEEVLLAAVDATLEAPRLAMSSQASLAVGDQAFALSSSGSVDYDADVADLVLVAAQAGQRSEVTARADGTDAWLAVEGPAGPAFPDDATWVEGDAASLLQAPALSPGTLLGAVVALRAADGVEEITEFDAEDHDGVTTRVFGLTVPYADAVAAAGADADAFSTALSLTGAAEQADLEIQVAVGPDDVVRTYDLTVESDADVSGGYDIDLTDVDRDVTAPAAPDPDDVATGPEAESVFSQLLNP